MRFTGSAMVLGSLLVTSCGEGPAQQGTATPDGGAATGGVAGSSMSGAGGAAAGSGTSGAGGVGAGGSAGAAAGGSAGAGTGGTGGTGGVPPVDAGSTCVADASWTVGLRRADPAAFVGYTLLAPMESSTTYLVDVCGQLVHSWPGTDGPGHSVYLLESGDLLRTEEIAGSAFDSGGRGGRVLLIDWEGNVKWRYEYSSDQHLQHHDVAPLPNGNVILIAWERKTSAEAIAAGRNPNRIADAEVWPDHLVEVKPSGASGGTIVWEWHMWGHLVQDFDAQKPGFAVVADHPELLDVNAGRTGADWTHTNSVAYHPGLDQLLLSVHELSEIWVIDHGTTTAEAAGHTGGLRGRGGDLLYRWGNPLMYDAGTKADQAMYGQHNAHWIAPGLPGEGHVLLFDNGRGRPGDLYSIIDELALPLDSNGTYGAPSPAYGPAAPLWSYQAATPTDFYADHISGAQRLPNGNTLVCNGPAGDIFEVTAAGITVWHYVNPIIGQGPLKQGQPVPDGGHGLANQLFRAERYRPEYGAFVGRDLTPRGPLELPAGG